MPDADSVSVLYVEPDDDSRLETATDLEISPLLDADVESCATLDDAIDILESSSIDCVVTEHELTDGSGLELVEWIRDNQPDLACILYTNATPDAIQTATFGSVVVEYLPKEIPDSETALARLIGNVVSQRSQLAYPIPESEDERLAAIGRYDVDELDTAATVDRLTELVASHFDIAIAFAGIVDAHEERFLACKGADWETLQREDTICTYTLLEDDHLVVENVQADDRFADVEALAELDIRSYAGVPLKTPDGIPIGALCLIHDEPRTYSDDEIADLHLFADELMEQLELRRRLRETERAVPKPDHEGEK